MKQLYRTGLLFCALLLVGVCTACGPGSDPGHPSGSEEGTVPLTIGTTDKISQLDPAASYDFHTWEVHNATMSGLLSYSFDGQVVPALAEALPVLDEDGRTWTITLRRGLRFAGGRELSAEDVVWSVERVSRLGGDASWFVTSFLAEARTIDTYTVAFELQKPTSFFPSLLAVPAYFPVDRDCYPADSIDRDSTCGGIGRYRISEWQRDSRLVLEANPDWPDEPPLTKQIVVRYLDAADTMRRALVDGTIDLAWNTLTPKDIDELRATEGVRTWDGPSSYTRMLVFTHTIAPFDDARARRAMTFLVDREALSEHAYKGRFSPLYSPIPDAMPGHLPTLPRVDVARGTALLSEAGYSVDSPMSFDLWYASDHYGDEEEAVATLIKEQLEATGMIRVALHGEPWSSYVDSTGDCGYQAFLLGWYPDYLDPSTCIDFFAWSSATPGLCSNYQSAKMDELVQGAQAETDQTVRFELYRQIQQLWVSDVPTLPLAQGLLVAFTRDDVDEVLIDAAGLLRYDLMCRKTQDRKR